VIVIPGTVKISVFVGAALILLLIPGPAVLYVVARSAEQGRLAGLVSDLGIHTATLVHILAAAIGLSALLASSAFAFSAVKCVGAAYLIWLGLRKIFGRDGRAEIGAGFRRYSYARLFRDGFVVNLLNPKTALFFFAFLPQFAEVSLGHVATQIAFLGLVFAALGLVTDGCYALLASAVGAWLKCSVLYRRLEGYVSGVLLIGLGVTATVAGNQRKYLHPRIP
jgi:threonine/homoserine/homoserine lactone efflux protein